MVEAAVLLVKATGLRGNLQQQISHVRVTALKDNRILKVVPATDKSDGVAEVKWKKGCASFKASKVLIKAGFPVDTRYKKRHKVHLLERLRKVPPW